jgi:predicted HTH domain antitoxin
VKIEVDIPIPEGALDEGAKERVRHDALEAAVLRLFDERRISSTEAARELGLTRIAFWELAKARGVPMHDYTFEDWQDDKATIDQLWPEIGKNVKDSGGGRLK